MKALEFDENNQKSKNTKQIEERIDEKLLSLSRFSKRILISMTIEFHLIENISH